MPNFLMIKRLPAVACWFASLAVSVGIANEKNILLIVTDDESPTLGCYGDPIAQTPHVDTLARDGMLFKNAFATTASCSASRSVILTGLHNHKTGQYGHQHHYHKFASYYDAVSLSLPRVLASAGYRTARCGKFHVAPEFVYHFETKIPSAGRNVVRMAENCRQFLENRVDSRPFFLYFATDDPHRSSKVDQSSELALKPNLFGNVPERGSYRGVTEVLYEPQMISVPSFLPDSKETRAELANYYQSCSRIDQGLGRLIDILKQEQLYEKTLIIFTSDHGMAFAGAKTTVYEPGLRVPFVVRNPYQETRGCVSEALISHVDITPTLLDFAGTLNRTTNGPQIWQHPNVYMKELDGQVVQNRNGGNEFRSYHGKSWLSVLEGTSDAHRDAVFASHTFHEITMYYPMRVVRDKSFKLIWNIAHELEYPFASDLWDASSWQAQYRKGMDAEYGTKTIREYIHRPEFELYDMRADPHEITNLSDDPNHAQTLKSYQSVLQRKQRELEDPWVSKWRYE